MFFCCLICLTSFILLSPAFFISLESFKDLSFAQFWELPNLIQIIVIVTIYHIIKEIYERINEKCLDDEVVLITGAGSGIGRLTAIELAKSGCRLALWDLSTENVNKVAGEIKDLYRKIEVRAYTVDVTNRQKVYDVGRQVIKDFKQVDILINNAGIVSGKKILENNDTLMEKTMQVNTVSHFWTIKVVLPGMLERNHGHVVTIASMAGIVGSAGLVDYCASKYGAVGIADSLRMELRCLKSTGVFSTCICPFYIKTGMFEGVTSSNRACPILEPHYVAERIVKGIKRNSVKVLIPRFCYVPQFLYSIAPAWFCDRLMDKVNKSMDTFQQTRNHEKIA